MNIQQIMQQAQKVQKEMQEAQEKIAAMEFEGQAGGGLVQITLTGKGVVTKVVIDPELCKPEEKEVLEDLVAAAFNDTKKKIEDAMGDTMGGLASSLGLPPDFKMPI